MVYLHQDSIFGTQQSVPNTEVSIFQGCPLRGVPLYCKETGRLSPWLELHLQKQEQHSIQQLSLLPPGRPGEQLGDASHLGRQRLSRHPGQHAEVELEEEGSDQRQAVLGHPPGGIRGEGEVLQQQTAGLVQGGLTPRPGEG